MLKVRNASLWMQSNAQRSPPLPLGELGAAFSAAPGEGLKNSTSYLLALSRLYLGFALSGSRFARVPSLPFDLGLIHRLAANHRANDLNVLNLLVANRVRVVRQDHKVRQFSR